VALVKVPNNYYRTIKYYQIFLHQPNSTQWTEMVTTGDTT